MADRYSSRGLGFTERGLRRLRMKLREALPDLEGWALYRAAAAPIGIDRQTVARLLERSDACNLNSIRQIYRFYVREEPIWGRDYDQFEPYCVLTTSSEEDHLWAVERDRQLFGQYAVEPGQVSLWLGRNPQAFHSLKKEGRRIGYITVLPVDLQELEPFIRGEVPESEIPAAAILSPNERARAAALYVPALVVDGDVYEQVYAVDEIIKQFLLGRRLATICEPRKLQLVYALAATDFGEKLMTRSFGFSKLQDARDRKDDQHLYCAPFATLRTAALQRLYRLR